VVGIHADVELEAPLGAARVVDDHGLEHRGIGNADVVALGREQDGCARGQLDHVAQLAGDVDQVVDVERVAQA